MNVLLVIVTYVLLCLKLSICKYSPPPMSALLFENMVLAMVMFLLCEVGCEYMFSPPPLVALLLVNVQPMIAIVLCVVDISSLMYSPPCELLSNVELLICVFALNIAI